MKGFIGLMLALAAVAPLNAEVRVAAPLLAAQEQGTSWKIADHAVAVKTWDVLALVENEYSKACEGGAGPRRRDQDADAELQGL